MLAQGCPPFVISRLRIGLGTFIAVDAAAAGVALCESGVRAAFDAMARVDALLHPTRSGSDLAAINTAPPGARLAVQPWTWEVLALSQRLHRLSGGAFDPCVPAGGTLADLELLPRVDGVAPGLIPHARLMLDLGGIGKGFAVDRGIDALRAAGCQGGLVNAGGDLAVFGGHAHVLWCRDAAGTAARVTLRDAALASSDAAATARPGEHRGYYNGRDGRAVTAGSAAVTAASCAVADALTTCLLAGAASPRGLLQAFGARRIGG